MFLDKTQKKFDHQIIVTPNFKSADYLYSKINLLNAKIIERDTAFLKRSVGLKHPEILKGIKIKPITDVYKFIENKTENFELIKLMAEAGDINKILEDNLTSKNYTNHEIIVKTDELASDESTIQPILNFLNESDYFKKIQIEEFKNTQIKLSQNDTIISQIDAVLNGFSSSVNRNQQSDKLVYYNENTQLNDVIKTKEALIYQQGVLRVDLIGMDKIIKENSATLNIENRSSINGKLKLVLPILFLLSFIFIHLFLKYYKSQMRKAQLI
ncbi:hypothetical protein [Flavobacterium degerlachei]|uniref:hypothetical protein n=1 Tax=Flavobacterium degerlachei TaxID=229203 RepID=UPI001FDED476|nr:hypothetical protein [Flavobacterium degerlachei]